MSSTLKEINQSPKHILKIHPVTHPSHAYGNSIIAHVTFFLTFHGFFSQMSSVNRSSKYQEKYYFVSLSFLTYCEMRKLLIKA